MKKNFIALIALMLSASGFAQDIITDQPAGDVHSAQYRSGYQILKGYYYTQGAAYDGGIGKYVVADDAIYLYNPISSYPTNSYLKLDKETDSLYVAHLPQPIYDDGNGILYAERFENFSDADAIKYMYDNVTQDVYFSYKDGVLAMEDSTFTVADSAYNMSYPDVLIALTNDYGQWRQYGEGALRIKAIDEAAAVKPADLQATSYRLVWTGWSEFDKEAFKDSTEVDVAIDGNDIYVNNPYTKDSLSWIKGTFDGTQATFTAQYVGVDNANNRHLWFKPATYQLVRDTEYTWAEFNKREYTFADQLTLAYDADSRTLTAPQETSFLLNTSKDKVSVAKSYDDPVLTNLSDYVEQGAVPEDPKIWQLGEYDWAGEKYDWVMVSASGKDVDGNGLNTSKLFYNFFINNADKPYKFTEANGYSEELAIPEDYQTDLPVYYENGASVQTIDKDTRDVFFYYGLDSIDSIGVQVIYRGGGEEHRSNIVWEKTIKGKTPNGITTVSAANAGKATTVYYDVTGKLVARPDKAGLYIEETTAADGSKKIRKVLRK